MNRKRGWLWMLAGVIMALVAAALVYRLLATAAVTTAAQPTLQTQPVVVLLEDVPRGTVLTEDMVALRDMPADFIPDGAVTVLEDAIGKMALTDLKAGEILLADRVETPTNITRDIALTIPEGMVVIALPANDLLNRVGMLKPGDRVDILFSLDLGEGTAASLRTLDALQNVEIQAIVVPPVLEEVAQGGLAAQGAAPDKAVLVAVDPQDALVLKYLVDAGAVLDFALRAPDDDSAPILDPVDLQYLADQYGFDLESLLAPPEVQPAPTPTP